jgi:hypothetical protein
MDEKAMMASVQQELAKRLRLKRDKYPDRLMRILWKLYPEEVEEAYLRGDWELLPTFARGIYLGWVERGARESHSERDEGDLGGVVPVEEEVTNVGYDDRIPVRPPNLDGEAPSVTHLSDAVMERSKVFSECLARETISMGAIRRTAEGLKRVYAGVKGFRVKYLNDQLLSPEQARELLTSPVAAHWHLEQFRQYGVLVVGHTYEVKEGHRDDRGLYPLVEVPVDGSDVKSFHDRRPLVTGPWEIPDKPEDARSNGRLKRELKTPTGSWKVLAFPGEDGYTHRVLVRPRSVLGDLHAEVSRLIQRYPWEEANVVWFVLTGEAPWVAPLTWQFRGVDKHHSEASFSYGFITLKIEPWVPVEEVQQVYGVLQRRLRGKDRARRLETKSLDLLRFVSELRGRRDKAGNEEVDTEGYVTERQFRRRMGKEYVALWDEQHPNEKYDGDTWRFWRGYDRARRAVMSPSYGWPAESTATSKEQPKTKQPQIAGTDPYGRPIFAGKWYLLHPGGKKERHDYTGTFESRNEALADPRSENSEVLTARQLVASLAERERYLEELRKQKDG